MANYQDSNILFSNVTRPSFTTSGRIAKSDYTLVEENITNTDGPVINAIDIDWNGAQLDDQTLNTTGEVLSRLNDTYTKSDTYNKSEIESNLNDISYALAIGMESLSDRIDGLDFYDKETSDEKYSNKDHQHVQYITSMIHEHGEYATETYVDNKIETLVGEAPEALNTLKEISDKLFDNDDAVAALTSEIASKANKEHTHNAYLTSLAHSHAGYSSSSHSHEEYATADHSHNLAHTHSEYLVSLAHSHTEYASNAHSHNAYLTSLAHSHSAYLVSLAHSHTDYATKTYVSEQITTLVGNAPETLDTLGEIAAALNDNATMTMVSEAISTKANAEDVYTKEETDEIIDGMLSTKEAEDTYQPLGNYLTEHQDISGKANAEDVYTKEETDEMFEGFLTLKEAEDTYQPLGNYLTEHQDISNKANVGDSYTKAESDERYLQEHQSLEGYVTKGYVDSSIEAIVGAAPENFDTLKELADVMSDLKVVDVEAVEPVEGEHYTQEEIDAAQEGDDAYGKTTEDWKVEPVEAVAEQSHNMTISEFVTTTMQEVNEKAEVQALQTRMAAIERAMQRMDANAYQAMVNSLAATETLETLNTVTIEEGTIADIIIPETTKSKTVTGELDPNSTLTLNSRYGVTINNTSAESTNLEVNAPAVDGYNAATITLKDGEFDTVTLTDASLTVQDNATVQNVVITEDTTKTLTINAKFEEGATVTSNSEAPITLNNKNGAAEAVSVTLNAPGSTVTLSGGQWVTISGAVSQNTLIIKKNAKVQNLNITEGNVVVEVARQADIANVIIGTITLAEGCNIDYIHDEVTNDNSSVLTSTGEHTLTEDINKGGRFAPGTFASDDIVWNLNGHNMTFTNTAGYANFLLRGTLHLEINGNGTITNNAGDYGFWLNSSGSKLVVNGGTYYAATHILYAQQGTIEVNGGEFHLTDGDTAEKDANGNFKFLLNCYDANYTAGTAKIIVRGGTFYGFNPAESYGEPGSPVSFVAQGYQSVQIAEENGMKIYQVQQIS